MFKNIDLLVRYSCILKLLEKSARQRLSQSPDRFVKLTVWNNNLVKVVGEN